MWIAKWFLSKQIRPISYYWTDSLEYVLCPRTFRTTLMLLKQPISKSLLLSKNFHHLKLLIENQMEISLPAVLYFWEEMAFDILYRSCNLNIMIIGLLCNSPLKLLTRTFPSNLATLEYRVYWFKTNTNIIDVLQCCKSRYQVMYI